MSWSLKTCLFGVCFLLALPTVGLLAEDVNQTPVEAPTSGAAAPAVDSPPADRLDKGDVAWMLTASTPCSAAAL